MKNVLIIGASSKIAKRLLSEFGSDYEYTLTTRSGSILSNGTPTTALDLSDIKTIKSFLAQQLHIKYDGVFVFAATYSRDADILENFLTKSIDVYTTNALAPIAILRSLEYNQSARIFLFGDAGISQPKPGFTSYTISKAMLKQYTKSLAVELAPKGVSVITFALGPTVSNSDNPEYIARYKNRRLLQNDDPAEGLVKLCRFIIETPSVNVTGTSIIYDGGAYLKRAK